MTNLLVNAYSLGGAALSMFTTIKFGNTTVKTGFTPLSYGGGAGTYNAVPQDYGNYVFDHWGSGSTTRSRTETLTSTDNKTWTAYYRTTSGGSGNPPPPPSSGIGALIPKTGFYAAIYSYPDTRGQWQALYNLKVKYPGLPMVGNFNPNSGPGSAKDTNIANWVAKLRSVGIIMIGYTYSQRGGRSASAVQGDAYKYKNWYGADGIFIDEFPTSDAYTSYASGINAYCHATLGMKMTMGNPGTNTGAQIIRSVDVMNITEGVGYPPYSPVVQWYQTWVANGLDKRHLAMIRHTTSSLDTNLIRSYVPYCGLIEFTNGNDSNGRWFNVAPYWDSLCGLLNSM